MMKEKITQDVVKEVFTLDGGNLVWVKKKYKPHLIGKPAGSINTYGYVSIGLYGKDYLAHRLVWLYVHGNWPVNDIDHINGNRLDNRIENLRDVTRSENLQNLRKAKPTNKLGVLGVSKNYPSGGFSARIRINGEIVRLGSFETVELANAAYLASKRVHHATCTI